MTKGKLSSRSNQSGAIAEQWAREFLERQGLVTLHRNYRTSQGEIDLIMREGKTVVFVEVRLRNHAAFGGAASSIDHRKQRRIIAAARHFLQATQAWDKVACRFDAVCLSKDITNNPPYQVEWLPNAFDH
ncbi:YraN family protein [uncultured Porticoccus sp.]|uniref:YraN family protein n=1 Tax=uncultured Porticoccus sp. TaxID=1256050 RepID=UPI00260E8F08|nr:YraN family protein [uncultured Porticoccus sp.]